MRCVPASLIAARSVHALLVDVSDFEISKRQLELYVDEYDEVPYNVIRFLTSYINYGGRVTDSRDFRTIDVICRVRRRRVHPSCVRCPVVCPAYGCVAVVATWQDIFVPEIMTDDYCFVRYDGAAASSDTCALYKSLACNPQSPQFAYMRGIDQLPLNADPEVFGMHSNANIACDQSATIELFDNMLSLQVRRWLSRA
jgi:dynein heavy chain